MPYETALLRPYCTLQDVQDVTGNREEDGVELTLKAINKASRLIEDLTEIVFWFHDHTTTPLSIKRHNVVGKTIFLGLPVLTLTEIKIDGEVANLTEFEIDGRYIQSLVTFAYPFTSKMEVKGTSGYALSQAVGSGGEVLPPPTLPATIARAATLTAAAISGQWLRERIGLDGSKDTMLETRIPGEVEALLKKWKRKHTLVGF